MTIPDPRVLSCGAVAGLLAGLVLSGCGSDAPDAAAMAPVRPQPATASAPPRPKVPTIAEMMATLGIDARVQLEEQLAPATYAARKAVLEFFDSFARGDARSLGSMLSDLDREELNELDDSGEWSESTSHITQIQVQTGQSPDGQNCTLAIFWFDDEFEGDDYQPQLWYYEASDLGATFDAVSAPPGLIDWLSGDDWIAAWFAVLEEELALADKPDEEYVVPQKDVSDTSSRGSSARGPGVTPRDANPPPSNPSRPSAPNMPGKRTKKPKRPAPGKGGP